MSLLLGQSVPDFTQQSTQGDVNFHEWIGDQWCVLFSHPADFTPVCTTELGEVARLKPEWEKRNVKVMALSVDPVDDHQKWINDIEETQNADIWYPILADSDKSVSNLYGMIHPDAAANITVRSVYVIDPNKKLRLTLTYPPSTGRDFREILRTIDSLQLTDGYKVATPVNWRDGDDCIIVPSLTNKEEIAKLFPKGHTEIKPYLRVTPQPNK